MLRPRSFTLSSRARHNRAAGFTVVELMITVVVAALVAAATFTFFAGQQRVYDVQTKLVNVQQNVSMAMEMLVRFVRAAGNGMIECVRLDSDGVGADTGAPAPVGPALPLTSAPATGLRAYLAGTGNIRIPPLWITNGTDGAPDTLTVAFGDGTFGSWKDADLGATIAIGKPNDPLRWPAAPASLDNIFKVNEFVVVLDTTANPARGAPYYNDRGCTLFEITGVDTASDELQHASSSKWNPASNGVGAAMVPFDYTSGSTGAGIREFGTLNWVRFAIRPGTATTAPALTMERLDQGTTPEVLSDGIADLQVAYACDNNPDDGLISDGPNKLTDEWILNTSGDATPTNCQRPDAIRITLIARGLTPDVLLTQSTTNIKPAVEDGAAGAGADQFRYRIMTTTVFPRN
jgi:type II secretory pathway pseudopilin PulG